MGRFGAVLVASWAVLGLSWRPLRPSRTVGNPNRRELQCFSNIFLKIKKCCVPPRALLEGLLELFSRPPWDFGASWCRLGRLGGLLARLTPEEAVLGASLGRLSAFWTRFRLVLGSYWGSLGPIWGRLGSLMGCLGAILEASGAVLGGRKSRRARTSTSFKYVRETIVFCFLGLSWMFLEASWGFLGAPWGIWGLLRGLLAHLMPSEAVLRASRGRLGVILERFRAVVGPSRELLRPSWGPLGPTWGPLGGLLGCLDAILEASYS